MDVRQGDIVVAATDGLFDNVYPDEAASIVAAAKVRRAAPLPQGERGAEPGTRPGLECLPPGRALGYPAL